MSNGTNDSSLYDRVVQKPSPEEATTHMRSVLGDHQTLLGLIVAGDADAAEQKAREDMRASCKRFTQSLLAINLGKR